MVVTQKKPHHDPGPVYSYGQLADRIEQELGVRPALSTLRAAAARASSARDYPPRITAGMPAPLPPRTHPARFAVTEVDSWLRHHPWRVQQERLAILTRAVPRGPARVKEAVVKARAAGASWTAVTAALQAGGWPYGRAHTHQLFRNL